MDRRVVVIGAGLGGLAAAARLARSGFEVTVLESQGFAGGKAGSLELEGYRFDTGPSLLTMPAVFEELFRSLGADMEKELPLERLEPICAYFFPDGTGLESSSDQARFAAEIAANTHEPPGSLERYLAYSRRIYELTAGLFLERSLHEPATFLNVAAARAVAGMGKIDALRSMHQANASYFHDPRMVQLFDRYATYSGSSPYRAPATLNIIPHVEYELGAWAPRDGIVAIPSALERLARSAGARFHLNTRVDEILHRDGEIVGVRAGETVIESPIVVSNADVLSTYRSLLRDAQAPMARRYERLEPSSSGLVFLWGIGRRFERLRANNIFFSSDYAREFGDLFDRLKVPAEPTVYVNVSSRVTAADAPPGCENWFVLINAPRAAGQDWEEETRHAREAILRRLSRELDCPVEDAIRVERTLTPPEIEAATGSTYGSLYGISSNTRLAAFLRHPNRSSRHRGLYFCGGSAHPGGGMPLAVLSGAIAAGLVERYEGRPAPLKPARRVAARPGRERVARRRDLRIMGVITLFYAVGLVGHALPATRELMLALTPATLAIFGAVVAFVALRDGGARLAIWGAGTYAVTFLLEAVGVATGVVFGPYSYGEVLGLKLFGVPIVIGFNWMLVVLGGVGLARLLHLERAAPLVAGAACVALDLVLEPVAIRLGYWVWHVPEVPVQNYAAWFLIAAACAVGFQAQGCRLRSRVPAAYLLLQLLFFAGILLFG